MRLAIAGLFFFIAAHLFASEALPPEGIVEEEGAPLRCYLHNNEFLRIQQYPVKGLVKELSQLYPKVRAIYLQDCGELTEDDASQFRNFHQLHYLKICRAYLDNLVLVRLVSSLPASLLSLEIGESLIVDSGLISLGHAHWLKNLTRLAIWNKQIESKLTRSGLNEFISTHLADQLRHVTITLPFMEARRISEQAFDYYAKRYQNAEEFYVKDCDSIKIYQLDNPLSHSFKWRYDGRQWFLERALPAHGLPKE